MPDRRINTRGFDYGAVFGEVAAEDNQTAIGGVRMFHIANDATLCVGVQAGPTVLSTEWLGRADSAGGGVEQLDGFLGGSAGADVPGQQPFLQRGGVNGVYAFVQLACSVKLTEDGGNAASAVDIFHVVVGVRGHL